MESCCFLFFWIVIACTYFSVWLSNSICWKYQYLPLIYQYNISSFCNNLVCLKHIFYFYYRNSFFWICIPCRFGSTYETLFSLLLIVIVYYIRYSLQCNIYIYIYMFS
uniref:7TM_GPCR_Srx domain-containing protein n=1 Tax=Heterorhabditis bacteriophora TaxID=37862 RepID=A0A1I7XJP4_HETBA